MKQYSRSVRKTHEDALLTLKRTTKKVMEDSIMDSKTFAEEWEPFIRDIGLTKESNGKKYYRSQEYASIGVMDRNDLIQEAYCCFLEAYDSVNWKSINKSDNPEAELWSYLKKRTIFRVQSAIWEKKDGMRLTDYAIKKAKKELNSDNMKVITSLFSQLEVVFFNNQEDTAITKYETDLLGYFLESHMDDFLDLNFKGKRNPKGIERELVMQFYGIDGIRKSYKELSDTYKISASTIGVVIKRAITKLQCDDSKNIIANFCREYSIRTNANIYEMD